MMQRFLKIMGWGIAIWGLSLVWPLTNIVLPPRVADALVVGLVVAVVAFFLGRNVGRIDEAKRQVFPAQPTRPTPVKVARNHFSRQTAPMPVLRERSSASRPTRPIPLAR
jgi:hypothetical protein